MSGWAHDRILRCRIKGNNILGSVGSFGPKSKFMNFIAELSDFDNLIVEHTKPPVTSILRVKLQSIIEQAEAYVASVAEKDKALAEAEKSRAEQSERISQLTKTLEQWETASKLKRPRIGGTPPFTSQI